MRCVQARAEARVGLLGNPSDLYGGRGLGFSVEDLGVVVRLSSAASLELPEPIFEACWSLFEPLAAQRSPELSTVPHALDFESNVPFQSGLSGSSALLIAALRAWGEWYDVELSAAEQAELALRTEVEVLGLRAGPLDRLVQAFGGLVAMNFADPFGPQAVRPLDEELLPPLLVAWHGQPGESSGDVHEPVFARWQAGDVEVRSTMEQIALNADAGSTALEARDLPSFRACIDRNFDLRAGVFPIQPADADLIGLGRGLGAAAKFPGSGGSVLFVARDEAHLVELEAACDAAGHRYLRPCVGQRHA